MALTSNPGGPKPLSWWVMQCIMAPAIFCLPVAGMQLGAYLKRQTPRGDGTIEPLVWGMFFVLTLWALAIMVTTWRRMPAARWLGGAFIALAIIIGSITLAALVKSANVAGMAGNALGVIVLCCWLYAYALSKEARRYLGLA